LVQLFQKTSPKDNKFTLSPFSSNHLSKLKRIIQYIDKELLAITSTLEKCRHLLEHTDISLIIFSDHRIPLYQKKPPSKKKKKKKKDSKDMYSGHSFYLSLISKSYDALDH